MHLDDKVYVMNSSTWEIWRDRMLHEASRHESPMAYMKVAAQLEVVIDDRLRTNVIEVYEKNIFGELEDNYESGEPE